MEDENNTVYLHGDIELKIIEARSLPNMDLVTEHVRRAVTAFGSCRKHLDSKKKRKKQHKHHNNMITSDPYVSVNLAGARVASTRVISNSQSPVWNESLRIPVAHPVLEMEFEVKDDDVFGADHIGVANVPAERVASGEVINEWFPLIGPHGKPHKPDSAILLQIKFTPCHKNPLYQSGVWDNYAFKESHFPVRHGSRVTLYQDAHCDDTLLPEIKLDEAKRFVQGTCWEDICHAILEAHHLVYIIGWSIYDKVKLIREPTRPLPKGGDLTLGELLKYKSQEGVRVLLLIWDDKTSHNKFFLKTEGVMQTHDEETKKYFKRSSVTCVLAPRYASSKLSVFKQQVVGTLYTHHQKCVITDTQSDGNTRKIKAFIGGLDLCDGRYDTPEHRLFQDLNTVFEDDFHNPTFAPGTKAPRQPWHDLHCQIEGPAAYDVLANFEQRWKKATRWSAIRQRLKKLSHLHDDALLRIERISWIASPSPSSSSNDQSSLWVTEEDDPENWHVQIFRSIDSGSVKGFYNPGDGVEQQPGLIYSKHVVVDKSIQMAYIQAIRSAQHFIYIENQYFVGSSFAWPSYKNAGADNLIPMELALKIASKIRANERFTVYVVIPLWPEGVPNSASVQEILYWQGQTMQMMYEIIAEEIKSADLEYAHPTDYLNFYCLGNREERFAHPSATEKSQTASHKYGRFMIYVHAKGIIVDDEHVILGSANINQRSMDGSRDTEIAMGGYQPHYTWAKKKQHPHGQIYGYRMSLWVEHLGKIEKCFEDPTKLECVSYLNRVAEDNWRRFNEAEFSPLQGHLLKYPVKVESDGKVRPLPGFESFPDVGGKVLGSPTTLPDALTT